MSCPGCYSLDCYCDNHLKAVDASSKMFHSPDGKFRDPYGHVYDEFPHQYTAELGSTCRADAKKDGWLVDYRREVFLCPKCNPKSPKYAAFQEKLKDWKKTANS